jgi:hypothetical protein
MADPQYWFAAKRYGYGWGRALCWQGWAVYAAYVGGLVADGMVFLPSHRRAAFEITLVVLTVVLVSVVAGKGEPARWRWGKGSDAG